MRRFPLIAFALLVTGSAIPSHAEVPPLLRDIAERWSREPQQWSFTQYVRESDSKGVVEDRLERFDLSAGYEKRWRLVKLNGRTPTGEEVEEWSKKKNRGKKRDPKSWLEYVDLENARVKEEDTRLVTYEVPLKRAGGGFLFPGDKVAVVLTIDKQSRSIAHAQASIDAPFNVALGLAQVVDLDLNLSLPEDRVPGGTPTEVAANEQPTGKASAVVNRFGKRVEYTWSEFSRSSRPALPRS